jgi:hypothetical protein
VTVMVVSVDSSSMLSVIWHLRFPYRRFLWIFRGHFSHFTSASCVKSTEHCTQKVQPYNSKFIVSEWKHIPILSCFLRSLLVVQAFTFWMLLLCLLSCPCSAAHEVTVVTSSTWYCKLTWMVGWCRLRCGVSPTLSMPL